MINYELKNSVAVIQLNRPEKFNSFIRPMSLEMQDCLRKAEKDENVRAILITAAGKAFCAGQDLAEAISPDGPGIERIVLEHYNPIIQLLRSIEKPTVSAVNGVAAGAGANIALACDIVVAGKSASFIQAFSKIGLIPDSGGTFILPRLVGLQRAAAMMMMADKVTSDEAQQIGMIYKVFEDEKLEEEAMKIAIHLSMMPTKAIGLTKKLLNESMTNNLEEQLKAEAKAQVIAGSSEDNREGIKAFLEKRAPVFKGK